MPNLNKVSPYQINKGQEAEALALHHLETQGFQLLHRNFRCKLGEIDLIGAYQNQLLFVEVRFRKNAEFGGAAASIDVRKQQKLIRTAQLFLKLYPQLEKWACRFDVIAISPKGNAFQIDWIQNAFY